MMRALLTSRVVACVGGASILAGLFMGGTGCGRPATSPDDPADLDAEAMLSRCDHQQDAEDVTSWRCGELLAIEAVVLPANDRDIKLAFDDFAATFGGASVRRVDSIYTKGDSRVSAMRLEGEGPNGEALEAQMVAVMVGSGVRMVTCSNRSTSTRRPVGEVSASCGAVVAHLVAP